MNIERTIAEIVGQLDCDLDALHAKYLAERDKRVREDGVGQYVETTGEYSHYVDDPYVGRGFTREPVFDAVQAVVIRGGFGGLLMRARLRQAGITSNRSRISGSGSFVRARPRCSESRIKERPPRRCTFFDAPPPWMSGTTPPQIPPGPRP